MGKSRASKKRAKEEEANAAEVAMAATVQRLQEIFKDHSEQGIRAALLECNMKQHFAIDRLLSQQVASNEQGASTQTPESSSTTTTSSVLVPNQSDLPNVPVRSGEAVPVSLMLLPNSSLLPDVISLCWRSDFPSLSMANRDLRAIVRDGRITTCRKQLGLVEHWFFVFEKEGLWFAFDPYNRAWHNVPVMPEAPYWLRNPGLPAREIMCVGSELLTCAESPVDTMHKFQAFNGTWSLVAGMTNQPAYGHAWAVHEDKIFAAGGCDADRKSLPSAHMYNSETGLWTPIRPMHHARMFCKGAFMDGKFYVVGGKLSYYDKLQTTTAEVYDPNSNAWSLIENFFTEDMVIGSFDITVVNKEMYHASPSGELGWIHKYSPRSGDWLFMGCFPWDSLPTLDAYLMAAYRPVRDQPFEHLVLMLWRMEKSDLKRYVDVYVAAPTVNLNWVLLTSESRDFGAYSQRLAGVMGY
ncbi:hypothetical protein Bca4012_020909 [Brassica carinata]|uniref:GBF-interacting protein 1 N-terminal domain-containing protein n=1 Tax=Brassica carinata TaxID=52824 RepID=A0A8X7WGZ1_BRACI|nr:hypothetical protein Bca52824_000719 [Brassica carinata]